MSFHNSTTGTTISDGMFIGNDANLAYVFNYEATPLIFATSATERMRIDSSGNMQFNGNATISSNTADGSDNAQIIISGGGADGDTRGASVHIAGNESGNGGLLQLRAGNGSISQIRSYTSGVERMRITSGGEFGFGTTSNSVQNGSIYFQEIQDVNTYIKVGHKTGSSSGADFIAFLL